MAQRAKPRHGRSDSWLLHVGGREQRLSIKLLRLLVTSTPLAEKSPSFFDTDSNQVMASAYA